MFRNKRLDKLERDINDLKNVCLDLVNLLNKEETKTETKAEKELREHKEKIDKAYQELFNYNERIAFKGE